MDRLLEGLYNFPYVGQNLAGRPRPHVCLCPEMFHTMTLRHAGLLLAHDTTKSTRGLDFTARQAALENRVTSAGGVALTSSLPWPLQRKEGKAGGRGEEGSVCLASVLHSLPGDKRLCLTSLFSNAAQL